MATTSATFTANKFGWTDKSNPNTHFSVGNDWMAIRNTHNNFYFGTSGSFPSSLNRRKLYGIEVTVPYKNDQSVNFYLNANACENFNADTITWNNAPAAVAISMSLCPANSSSDVVIGNSTSYPQSAQAFLAGRCIYVTPSAGTGYTYYTRKTLVAGGAPTVKIYYDDSAIVESKPVFTKRPADVATIDPRQTQALQWKLEKKNSAEYCADENFTQASAKFYWKVSTASSWNSINISGTAGVTSVWNIPANTFMPGKTINYYVQTTDTAGSVNNSDTFSVSTYASTITPKTYPSGTSVDSRAAQSFAWRFGTPDYAQQSAALQWRVQGASSWNSISASGTTKSLSVPGYTFPSGQTIEWRLTGTDYSGTSTTSSTMTFATLPISLTLTQYPNGNSVDSRTAKTVAWTLESSAGTATQSSATFYWRASGEDNYRPISVSGNTKSISVPAYTFTPGTTIEWYLSVTAKDGTVHNVNDTLLRQHSFSYCAGKHQRRGHTELGEAVLARLRHIDV